MKKKYIGWAYPTSEIAIRAQRASVGCWFLSIGEEEAECYYNVVYADISKDVVLEAAKRYSEEWAYFSMHEDKYK